MHVDVFELRAHITRLESAIRAHRDQRGDDRCWLDDEALYRALPEGYTPPARDTTVELDLCHRYIATRHHPETVYEITNTEDDNMARNWFKRWFGLMPQHWQAGLRVAEDGGAWAGELTRLGDGSVDVVVFFVHPSRASDVERALKGGGVIGRESPTGPA